MVRTVPGAVDEGRIPNKETGCVAHRWPHTLSVCLRSPLRGLYKIIKPIAELNVWL